MCIIQPGIMLLLKSSFCDVEIGETYMASQGDKIAYFLVGGFIGAGIAFLFSPRSGEETRKYLKTKYREESESFSEKTSEGLEYLEQTKDWLAERAKEGKGKLSAQSHQVVGALGEGLEKGKETINQKKESISRAVKAGKKAYLEATEIGAVEEKS